MSPKISIIIATYNAGKTLARCLQSIREEKTNEIELLVIDGGSKDNTLDIINTYQDTIDYGSSEPDKGIYDAWNKGITHAKGDWMMFIGADDYLVGNALSDYLNLLQQQDCAAYDLICAKELLVDASGKVLKTIGEPYQWDDFRKQMLIAHGASLHNKKLFQEVGLFSLHYSICADYEFLLRKKLKSLFVNETILYMQDGGASTTYQAVWQAFQVRKLHHSLSLPLNLFYFCKGIGAIIRNHLMH